MKRKMKTFTTLCAILLMGVLVFSLKVSAHPARVVDDADLLTASEEASLMEHLDSISEKYNTDVCVVTVNDFSQSSVMAAADDFYDYNFYGMGDDNSGVMLYISMAERDWYITTCGSAIKMFSDSEIQSIGEAMVDDLGYGNYYNGFMIFANKCDRVIWNATTYHWGRYLVISLIIGFLVALIYVASLKAKLKSVASVDRAANYVVDNSMNVTTAKELYLYRNVSVTVRESSSSGGSSTHSSSSGTTHGGGGGKF